MASSTDSTALVTNRQPVSRSLRTAFFMLQQVLDLDGDVVADLRELAVHRLDDGQRVRRPVEEIGIAKGDVLGARVDLPANVLQHDFALHDAKNPVVNGHHRAVPAQVFAAAAGFGIAGDLEASFRHQQVRVLAQRRQAGAIRQNEVQPIERDRGSAQGWPCFASTSIAPSSPSASRVTSSANALSNSPPKIVSTPSSRR